MRYPADSPFGRSLFPPSSVLLLGLGLVFLLQQILLPFGLLSLFGLLSGYPLLELMTAGGALPAAALPWLKLQLFSAQLVAFGALAWVLARAAGSARQELQLAPPAWRGSLWLAVPLALLGIPLLSLTAIQPDAFALPAGLEAVEAAIRDMEARAGLLQQALLREDLAVNLLVVALTPAVMEELFFRGYLQSTCRRMWNPHVAIWLTALLFSFIHFQFFGFFYRMGLGALFGYLVYYSGSLWPAVVAHAAHNAVGVLAIYGVAHWGWPAELEQQEAQVPLALGAAAALALAPLLWLYIHQNLRRQGPRSLASPSPGHALPPPSTPDQA